MKKLLIALLTLITTLTANAELRNSKLDKLHQEIIEKAARKECQVPEGEIIEIKTITRTIQVDNGITDYSYETFLEVQESSYDTYLVTVLTSYSDSYDHHSQDWGSYQVESVSTCIQM